MIIKDFNIFKYTLPFTSPIKVKSQTLNQREGLIIQITSNQDVDGFGEAAPLPGFSKESLDDVLKQLQKAKSVIINQQINNHFERLDGQLNHWLKALNLSSSAKCGIEMAFLNLIANTRKKPLYQLISTESHDHIRLSGLIQGTKSEVVSQAKYLVSQGYRTIKLKVGGNIAEDIEKVQAVNEILFEKAILHVDANQYWNIEEATEFATAIGPAAVDYIEEPFADFEKIEEFFDSTLIPVALDESISTMSFDQIKSISGVDVVVLKPTAIGGIEKTWAIMQQARNQAILPIISSAYESSIGILTLANISGGMPRDNDAGLDTLRYLKKDLLNEPLKINHGKIDISQQRIERKDINFDLLKKIV